MQPTRNIQSNEHRHGLTFKEAILLCMTHRIIECHHSRSCLQAVNVIDFDHSSTQTQSLASVFWQTSWFREVKCAVVWTNSIHLDDNNFVYCMMRDSETSLYMSSSILSKVAELKTSNFDCMEEGRNGLLRCFQQLRSYRDETETRNREEIPFPSRILPRGLLVKEDP